MRAIFQKMGKKRAKKAKYLKIRAKSIQNLEIF